MTKKLKIEFVSDVACPWCAIALHSLEQAVERTRDVAEVDIIFRPFELNPNMVPGGQNMIEHYGEKYARSPESARARLQEIKTRAAAVGFTVNPSDATRIYNTFNAHRLLAWARGEGKQLALKHQIFAANFTDQNDPGNHDILVAAAEKAGLDGVAARAVLESDQYAKEVRAEEAVWLSRGVRSVPALLIDDRQFISGGQPPEEFERLIRAAASGELEAAA
jgi:predicted DsbA family dithiol-disulfide isomerase